LREAAEHQQRAVAEKLQATAKFRAICDQAGVFAGIMTTDGTVIEANRLSLEACGYTLEQVAGREFWHTPWWAGNPEVQEKIRAATRQAAGGDPYTAELPYVWADGSKHIVEFALHPVRDHQGSRDPAAPNAKTFGMKRRIAAPPAWTATTSTFSARFWTTPDKWNS